MLTTSYYLYSQKSKKQQKVKTETTETNPFIMGAENSNCCKSDSKINDQSYNLKSQSNRMVQSDSIAYTQEQLRHFPPRTVAARVQSSNEVNTAVLKALSTLPDFSKEMSSERISRFKKLPEVGPYMYPDGSTYFGQYKNGLRHGYGEQIWKDGSLYQGFFEQDQCNGKGRLVHTTGDAYQGDWKDDQASGYGFYLHVDGTK